MTRKQIAAHHEAGHAVARMALGLGFRWVSVGDRRVGELGRISGGIRGLKRLNRLAAQQEVPPDLVALAVACIVSTLAGPYAEMRAGGGQLLSLYSGEDDLEVVDYLVKQVGLDIELFKSYVVPEAHRLLDTHWPAVERVAEALVDRSPRSLSYRQVAEIVRTA